MRVPELRKCLNSAQARADELAGKTSPDWLHQKSNEKLEPWQVKDGVQGYLESLQEDAGRPVKAITGCPCCASP